MNTQAIRKVGIIGLGKMGLPMPRHMRQRGFEVTAHDLDAGLCGEAQKLGVTIAPNARAVAAASEFVIVVVGFDSEAEKVVMGTDGIAAAARPGLVVGIASTVAPRTIQKLAKHLDGSGTVLIDMPLTRGERAAEEGKMLTMVGGDTGTFATVKPVLECFADSIFHVGDLGAGQVGKMV